MRDLARYLENHAAFAAYLAQRDKETTDEPTDR